MPSHTRAANFPPPRISNWAWAFLNSAARWLRETARRLLRLPRPARTIRKAPPARQTTLNLERLEARAAAGALTLSTNPLNFEEGVGYSPFAIAGLTDSDGNSNPSEYTVMVNWGDGSAPTQAYLYWTGSGFEVMAPGHSYAEEGSYNVTISVTDSDGSQTSSQATALVSDAPLSISGAPAPPAWAGLPFSGTLGAFTDADMNGAAGDFTATINWGDGTPNTAGTVVGGGGGGGGGTSFLVNGGHTYASQGTYNYTINIQDAGGSTLTEHGTITAANPLSWNSPMFGWNSGALPPQVTNPGAQTSAEGAAPSVQVRATDPNPGNPPLSFAAVGLPTGLSINSSTGLISGTVDYSAAEAFGGAYTPTVVVADALGASASQTFSWNVTDVVRSPVLSSIANQTDKAGDTVSLQASATQPDGDQLIYDASNLPPGLTIDSLGGAITGTIDPAAGAAGSPYAVTVTATDQGVTASTGFTWTVNLGNQPPVLTSPSDQTNAAGDAVSLSLPATDADNDALTYTAANLPAGLSIDPSSGAVTGTIANSAAGSTPYTVTLTASDGIASSTQTIHWTVNTVGVTSPGDQSNTAGDAVSLPITASDASGLALTFGATGLPPGLAINSTSGVISGTISNTAGAANPYAVTVTATDGTNSGSQTFNWAVAPLALTNPGNQGGTEGTAVSLQLAATDRNGSPTYSATGLPAGLSINGSTGLISGTLGIADHVSSPYQVTVTATDGANSVSQAFVWTVTPRVALADPGPQADATGDAVSLPATATDRAGATVTYSAAGLPAGLTINGGTGAITGTIAAGAASATPYAVTVTAADGTSSSSVTFPWTVGVISLPQIAARTSLDGDVTSLSTAAGYHGTGTLSYGATGLPPGLTINGSTGVISGTVGNTADAGGPYSVTVTATDRTNNASASFTWNVNPAVTLDPVSDQSNGVGDSVSLPVSAGDARNGTLTFSETGLPAGLSINGTTGVISGAIAAGADAYGPYAVTVTASDNMSSASETFNWAVTHVSLANPGAQGGVDGQAVSLPMQGRDADGDAVTFSAAGLPTGLSLNGATGVISGTIGATAAQGGPYSVTVTASDGH